MALLQQRAVAGESDALEQLLRVLAPHLSRAIIRCIGRTADADDCLQDVLVALARALPAFRGDSSVRQFAVGIAMRLAHSAYRRRRAQAQRANQLQQLEAPLLDDVTLPIDRSQGERQLLALYELLSDVPESQARALVMRAVLGYSVAEIARAFGVPVNTVRSRVRLARSLLRNRIEADSSLSELFERED